MALKDKLKTAESGVKRFGNEVSNANAKADPVVDAAVNAIGGSKYTLPILFAIGCACMYAGWLLRGIVC